MITDAQLEQLLRDERDSFGEPDAGLLDRASVDVFDSPEPVRRHRVRSLLVGVALLVPLVVAVLVVAGTPQRSGGAAGRRHDDYCRQPLPLHDQVVGTWQLEGIDTKPAPIGIGRSCGSTTTGPGRDPTAATAWAGRGACQRTERSSPPGAQSLIGCHNVDYAAILNAAATRRDRSVAASSSTLGTPAPNQTLVRDPLALPDPPAPGWLPGYSFFQADRVVTDQKLIDQFAALPLARQPSGGRRRAHRTAGRVVPRADGRT